LARQQTLDEFSHLRRSIDFFRSKQENKTVSLSLDERRRQKELDDQFKKEMDAERDRLAQSDFAFREFLLAPPPPPRIKAPRSPDDPADEEEAEDDEDDRRHYGKVDVHLRESLRVISDALELAKKREYWAGEFAPLSAQVEKRG
jgi:carboxyl-terminal processing protease